MRHGTRARGRVARAGFVAAAAVALAFGGGTEPGAGRGEAILFISSRGADGRVAFYVAPPDGGPARPLPGGARGEQPVWSPDGRRIAYTVAEPAAYTQAVWVMRADGGGAARLTPNGADARSPAWSPDGARIAYATGRSALHDLRDDVLRVVGADGAGDQVIPNTAGASTLYPPTWSPDGRRLAFGCNTGICTIGLDGSDRRQLAAAACVGDRGPAWSPDGRRIAFHDCDTTVPYIATAIILVNADGTGRRQVTSGGDDYRPVWSPDGRRLAFVSARGPAVGDSFTSDVYVVDADGRNLRNLTPHPAYDAQPSWGRPAP